MIFGIKIHVFVNSYLLFCLFFLLSALKYRGDKSSLYLHCALGTKLLTAEASDAFAAVYYRLSALNNDSLRRADLTAEIAADAEAPFKNGLRIQRFFSNSAKHIFKNAIRGSLE